VNRRAPERRSQGNAAARRPAQRMDRPRITLAGGSRPASAGLQGDFRQPRQ